MLSWHGLRLEAVCGMGCEEARGTVREKHGGGLGVGERQRAEKEGTRGADARGTTPRFRFEGRR